jgi:putative cell wall-binding protein
MKKILIFLFCLLIICCAGFVLSYDFEYSNTYTSAVCQENKCIDYLFTCKNGELIQSKMISGMVSFEDGWIDRRENKQIC